MRNSTVLKIVLTAALLLAGGGFLVYASLGDAQYYEFVDVVAKEPAKWKGRDLKLHGYVVPGSIVGTGTSWAFTLERNGEKVAIEFQGVKPDNLKDRSEVVAQGKLHTFDNGSILLRSTDLMAKCPSKYEGAKSNQDLF